MAPRLHVTRVRSPRLHVMEGTHVGRDLFSELCFTNPVARALHRVRVRVEGAGVHTPSNILVGNVEGHGCTRVPVVPKRRGELTLIASLDCTELPQVHGGATFQCEP
ncbi:protein-glutamine gamma-glutamyltransferase K-like [Lethenteron reissneri]|uniref:protein-glutamine gamma-glutamyltransferase K-like n=1 Tax=Lethenteron reissneri TaxID=7753 RepID=UPI002AB68D12|nr:protein-glutamine gamma-glutamyltransferase K-like [Lethenteron reissneri]XP_061404386.1 protein-glutamine gamma-glutamyltransferase K-like [Lethenteron reissneri]